VTLPKPEPNPSLAAELFSFDLSKSYETIPFPPSLEVSNVLVLPHPTSQARMSTTLSPANAQLVLPSSSLIDRSHASPSSLSTISSSRFDPQSSRGENVPVHPTPSLEASLTIPAHPHSTPPQRPLGVTLVDPRSSLLDLTLAPVSLTPSQEGSLNNEVSSTPAPRPSFAMHPPHSSSSSSIDVNFAFTFVTLTVLVSALFVVSAVIPTHSRKSWAKNEDIRSRQNSTTTLGNTFNFAQLIQLVQYKPHTVRLVFDPGGFAFAL
jgi:hypothetical protein